MEIFIFFLKQGLSHISDMGAYDHILFISALAAMYNVRQWKLLLFLITAFTIGHSIALALATFEIVQVNSSVVEFLIPITIIVTCILNLYQIWSSDEVEDDNNKMFHVEHFSKFNYGIVTFFGLIHGLGFSNYLRFIIATDESLFIPLLAFNLGLEFGQIIILAIILLLNFIVLDIIKAEQKHWFSILSFTIILISFPILIDTGKALFIES